MSRSISQIFDSMVAEKETFPSLDDLVPNPDSAQTFLQDLSSSSKVAIWRLMFWVIAFAIFAHEKLLDQLVIDVEASAQEKMPGVTLWYAAESLKFQNGFALVFDETTQKFIYLDTTSQDAIDARIIDRASARDINQVVTIKVATESGGVLQKITVSQKAGFSSYIAQIKIAGTKSFVISDDPDSLKVAYTIQFDPQLLTSEGELITDQTVKPVQEAINTYIESFPFDSTFRVMDLTDAIQLATGVVSATADVVESQFGAIPFIDILAIVTESYVPNSGYFATVDETGTETVPVFGDIPTLTPDDYDDTGTTYQIDDFARFEGIVYKANVLINSPAGTFDPSKFDTVSNLTFISI